MKKAARFGAPYRFEMVYFFTPTEASKNLIFFRPSVRRDNQGDVLTDRFARGVSKYPTAAGFQDVMIPSRVLLTITSSEDATIADKCAATSGGVGGSTKVTGSPLRVFLF